MLLYDFDYEGDINLSRLIFESEDENIARIDNNGMIYGVNKGKTRINISYEEYADSAEVVVSDMLAIVGDEDDENKPELTDGIYSAAENDLLDEILISRVEEAGYKTRAAAVAAARFLALDFPYRLNYFLENGRIESHFDLYADGEGRYYHKGLYLSSSRYANIDPDLISAGPAYWGESLEELSLERYSVNGLDCSGFISWALLQAGYDPLALLCERKHIDGDAADIIQSHPEMPVYTGNRELLSELTGYTLTRGVLCAMRRKTEPALDEILKDAHRVCVIDSVCDTTNIGAIFRSAAALGIDAVLLTRSSCDPLNRRAIRVSMGTIFLVPWTWLDAYPTLHDLGFKTAAMALSDKSISLDDPVLKAQDRLAVIMGTEGEGLPQATIDQADFTVRIPMYQQVDSLNVAAAAAVAFWELRK